MTKKKKVGMAVAGAVAAIALAAGGIYAYYQSQDKVPNVFETNNQYGVSIIEKFESPDEWEPGEEVEKIVKVRNHGTVDAVVRVKLTPTWVTKVEEPETPTTLPLRQVMSNDEEEDVAIIHFANPTDWVQIGDYYYYTHILEAGQDTNEIIDSVTLNSGLKPDVVCVPQTGTAAPTGYTYFGNCASNGGYGNATYTLEVAMESVQVNGLVDTFGVTETQICGSEGCLTAEADDSGNEG